MLFAIAFLLTGLGGSITQAQLASQASRISPFAEDVLISSLDPYQFAPPEKESSALSAWAGSGANTALASIAQVPTQTPTAPVSTAPVSTAPASIAPASTTQTTIAQATLPPDVDPYQVAPPLEAPPPPPPTVRPASVSPAPADTSLPSTPSNVDPYQVAPPLEAPEPSPPSPPKLSPAPAAAAPKPRAPQVIQAAPAQADGKTIKVTLPDPSIKPTDIPIPRPKFPALPRQEVRGVWITTNDIEVLLDRDNLRKALKQLASANFNTIYPVVWNSGYALHPSAVARRVGSPHIYRGNQNQDPLRDIIDQGHRNGLSVMPWFEFGFMAPPTSELVLQHPDWITKKRNGETTSVSAGGEVVWLNPFRPEVQRFITDLVMEVVNKYDIDGIQFDDHMSLPKDFGYDSYTRALYQKETGKAPPSNAEDAAWTRWRADKITEFIGDLHDAVKTVKPKTVFSVSPNYQDFAYRFHLQDWLNWVRQDFVDEIVMQVYRSDYNSFVQVIERPEIKEVKQKISTGIGILSGLPRRPISMAQIKQQSRAAHQRGLGVAYFYYRSLWDDAPESAAERLSGFRNLFPNPRSRIAQR